MGEEVTSSMLSNIETAFTTVLGWAGDIVTSLSSETGDLGGLGVLFGIGVAIAVIGGVIAIIKNVIWGA